MVLGELGERLSGAVRKLTKSGTHTASSEEVEACLKEVSDALLQADVEVSKVVELKRNVYTKASIKDIGPGSHAGRAVQKAVFDELQRLLDGGKPWVPKKNKRSVVLLVGLQGSGKTTTAAKYARWHKRRGYKPALVGADTFRAGALDQLKQAAAKVNVPVYGSYSETDPAVVARDGVKKLQDDGHDLVVVDTSGRHRQSEELLEEVRAVSAGVQPDATVFVMDATVGQAVREQAEAFKESSGVSGVIVTKLDGHARGGGAISAVAATGSPVMFIGTGEHMENLEQFEAKGFVSRLLGLGDLSGFADKVSEAMPEEEQHDFIDRMTKSTFTPRLLKEQYTSLMRMGSMSQMMSLLPGAANQLMPEGQDEESQQKIKKMLTMLDSMSDKELDTSEMNYLAQPHRVERIAKGSGHTVPDAIQLLEEYNRMASVMGKMKNLKLPKKGSQTPQMQSQNAQQIAKALPSSMLQQVGGAYYVAYCSSKYVEHFVAGTSVLHPACFHAGERGLQAMLKQLEGSGTDPSQLLSQIQGGGGGGALNPSNLAAMLGGGGGSR